MPHIDKVHIYYSRPRRSWRVKFTISSPTKIILSQEALLILMRQSENFAKASKFVSKLNKKLRKDRWALLVQQRKEISS